MQLGTCLAARSGVGRRFRVLVADDNEDSANTLALLLEMSGYEVRTAYDGEAAVHLAERWPPDAAILDIRMPGRDGYEVARAMRMELHLDVVLFAYSAQLTIRQRNLAASSTFDRCFVKGMDFGDLRQQLEDLLKCRPPGPAPDRSVP